MISARHIIFFAKRFVIYEKSSTFAELSYPAMQKRHRHILLLSLILCLSSLTCMGETIVLKSGSSLKGDIVFQNEEVVVIRDASGARFQYLRSDIEHIYTEDVTTVETAQPEPEHKKRVHVILSAGGGAAWLAGHSSGGTAQVDLAIGTADLLGRGIFLGGSFGYHGMFFSADNTSGLSRSYSFLPVQLRSEIPLTGTAHAPLLGLGLGYGIAANKGVKGGLYAGISLAWRYRNKNNRLFILGLFSEIQNARFSMIEHVDGTPYSGEGSHTFTSFGARLAVGL